jgi:methylmalonyl-CoA/ethylmalonyl-CoA epimerase
VTQPATRDPRPATLTLDHLVLAVRDLAAAGEAWSRTLGLRAEVPYTPENSHLALSRLLTGGAGGPPSHAEEAFLELAQPTTADHRVARFLDERGEGMFSISLRVDDLDATVAALRARGLPVSDPELGAWPDTRLARIPRARAHGVAIQLIERAAKS